MAIKKVIEIDVDVVKASGGIENFTQNFKKSEEAAKSLRTQLREAQAEVAALSDKFGATSKEAVEAAKRAAELKDRIGDAKSLTDAFNPDAKFKALTGALTGVAGGFSVVTGLMGTLGAESKEVEGAILKVQAAMAIASGAQAVGESIDSFKQLGAVVKSFTLVQKISAAAQLVWNAAMAANPIGAIVVVITALIAAGYALVKMFIASSDAAEKSAMANKTLSKEIDDLAKRTAKANEESSLHRDAQLKMAKASGESTASIRKLSEALANQEVAEKKLNAEKSRSLLISALKKLADDEDNEQAKENVKKANELYKKDKENFEAAILERRKLAIDNRVQERQEQTDAAEKAKELQKQANEKAIELAKARAEEEKRIIKEKYDFEQKYLSEANKRELAALDLADAIRKENEDRLKTDQQRKLDDEALAYEAKKKQIENDLVDEQTKRAALEELETNYLNNLNNINLEAQNINYENQKAADEKAAADAAIVAKNKEEQLQTNLSNIEAILSIGGSKFAKVQKALAIGEIVRDTIRAVNAATGNEIKVPAFIGTIPNPVKPASLITTALGIGSAIAKGAASIAAITSDSKSIPTGGKGVGAGGGGGGAPAPPQFNIVGQSSTNQLSQTIAGQQNRPIQTYVVGGQVSTQEALDRNAVQTSTFG
jgi:hypothetical protein